MARRNGRKNNWLASDDYTGTTVYANRLKLDFWGNRVIKPLVRNLQEISSPLNDPEPVPFYRGPTYETGTNCVGETIPIYIGLTNKRTPRTSPAAQAIYDVGIGEMVIGCTFQVQ